MHLLFNIILLNRGLDNRLIKLVTSIYLTDLIALIFYYLNNHLQREAISTFLVSFFSSKYQSLVDVFIWYLGAVWSAA
jgi:hypothetical protein